MAWTRWAREQAAAHELDPRQAHALLLLASIGNYAGEGFATRGDLAAFLRCSETHASRLVRQLRDRGLVIREGPENGRLRWRLNSAREPAAQLSLDAQPRDTQTSHPAPAAEAAMSHPVEHLNVTPVEHLKVTQKDNKAQKDDGTTGRGRAHEQDIDWSSLVPTLQPVLRILEDAPGLEVNDAAVNSALAAHPQPPFDHLRAAHVVASWAYDGGLTLPIANIQLNRAFERQDRRRGGRGAQPRPAAEQNERLELLDEMRVMLARARGEEVPA